MLIPNARLFGVINLSYYNIKSHNNTKMDLKILMVDWNKSNSQVESFHTQKISTDFGDVQKVMMTRVLLQTAILLI